MPLGLHFGALCEPIAVQLLRQGYKLDNVEHYQRAAECITYLALRELLPDSEKDKAQRRLFKQIEKRVQLA